MLPFTVILARPDDQPMMDVYHVTAISVTEAIKQGLAQADILEADDAVVFPGHHTDKRTGDGTVKRQEPALARRSRK